MNTLRLVISEGKMDAFYLGLGQVWKSHTQVVLGPQVDCDLSERRLPMADTLQM